MQAACEPVDASQLLRDILQSKEKYQAQFNDNNNSSGSIKDIFTSDCNTEMISPLLLSKSSDMAYNDRDKDNDIDNENENEGDIDIATDNNSFANDGDQSDDLDERSLDASIQEDSLKTDDRDLSLGDSKEAKRAHVEDILTSMKRSPHQGEKRQKRKQPQPQQHDANSLNSEEIALQRQIQQLQEQMQAVKRKREEDLSVSEDIESDDEGSKPGSPLHGESKRARVEHILSNMRSSTPALDNGYEFSGVSPGSDNGKRQKRKQTQPQQHDNSKSEHSSSLRHNNQTFNSKSDNDNEDCISDNNNGGGSGPFGSDAIFRNNLYLGEKEFVSPFHNGFDTQLYRENLFRHGFFGMRPDLDPMAALRNVSKSLQARNELGPLSEGQPKLPPVDLSKIANALKTEVAQAVNKAIDNVVSKVFVKQTGANNSEPLPATESSSQQDRQQQSQSSQQHQQQKHHPSPGLLPHFLHQQHQQQIQQQQHQQQQQQQHHHHQQQPQQQHLPASQASEREALKETVNNSQGEKKPELIVPFSDHLHFLERFGNRLHPEKLSAFEPLHKGESELITPHTGPSMPFHPFPYYLPTQVLPPMYTGEPEQTEALPLIVNTPKKKRTKVTDTRLSSPRGKPALLQDNTPSSSMDHTDAQRHLAAAFPHFLPPILPTSVAIANPSLSHSDILALRLREASFADSRIPSPQEQSRGSPRTPSDSPHFMSKMEMFERSGMSMAGDLMEGSSPSGQHLTSTLTPMHLRKAKLMFFYTRYPSSSILKMYFPDVLFNKNNTAQLVKWFSNFREFFYIQMEKYARQAIAEGCKHAEDLVITTDSELFRHLNLHYNRNNQIEVPQNFMGAVQAALREFYKSISTHKDLEPSWKKSIYKIIARMDETLPDFFKSPNWMEQLGDQ